MEKKTRRSPKLRPCPFCGDRNPQLEMVDQHVFLVACRNCGASIDVVPAKLLRLFDLVAKLYAIRIWNRREA